MNNEYDFNRVRMDIEENFPELQIDSVRFLGEGIGSKVFLVNNDLVFRFPRDTDMIAETQLEIVLLPHLRRYLSLNIPDFKYIGKQRVNGVVFVGYKMINGVGLEKEVITHLHSDLQDRLHKAIAGFITEMHSFPVDAARQLGVEVVDFRQRYTDRFDEFRSNAARLVSPDARRYVNRLYESFLSEDWNFAYTPVLIHGDLGANHIIYNEDSQFISGIIDFGEVCIGDPDYDYTYLYADYWGSRFTYEFPKYYHDHDLDRLLKKLEFFNRCNPVDHLLTGLQREDEGLLRYATRRLETEANAFG